MRQADRDKAWEALRTSKKGPISAIELNCNTHDFPINSKIFAIVGANGSKKSTLLDSIYHFVSKKPQSRPIPFDIMGIRLHYRGSETVYLSMETSPLHSEYPTTVFIDPSKEVRRIIDHLSRQSNLGELLAQYDPKILGRFEREVYQFVCNKAYSKIEIFEIEDPNSSDDVIPFFKVESQEISYDSFDMGFGELCAFYTIWQTTRCDKGSAIFLDEPDSHLSPKSRLSLIDYFVYCCKQYQHLIVYTTHATESISKLSHNQIIVLGQTNSREPEFFSEPTHKRSAMLELGFQPLPNILIATEDFDSLECIRQILATHAPEIAHVFDPQIVGHGESQIQKLLELFPSNNKICKLIATLDGDKRGSIQHDLISFLPGHLDPMQAAMEHLKLSNETFLSLIGIEQSTFARSLARAIYSNHHDFCSSLSRELGIPGMDTAKIRSSVISNWLRSPPICTQANELAQIYKSFATANI